MLSHIFNRPRLAAAISVVAFLTAISWSEAGAEETGAQSKFEEHAIEFHNQAVNLAGSLLLPRSEVPVPVVVFVHGAGRQTREPYREAGEYFASQGIAALIYEFAFVPAGSHHASTLPEPAPCPSQRPAESV